MFLNTIQGKEEIISFLRVKYPEKEFEYGSSLLVGQHKRDDLHVYITLVIHVFNVCTIISFQDI